MSEHAATSNTPSRVVVGVDGSEASVDAIHWAVRYAGLIGAEVEAVTAWALPTSYGAAYGMLDIDWTANAAEGLEKALAEALPDGSEAITRTIVEDHPAYGLIEAAKGADLLVVGSRGHGGFAGMLVGSVSEHVVAHAPCPVVVVRHLT